MCSQKAGEGEMHSSKELEEKDREKEDVCIREIANRVVGKRLITPVAAYQRQKDQLLDGSIRWICEKRMRSNSKFCFKTQHWQSVLLSWHQWYFSRFAPLSVRGIYLWISDLYQTCYTLSVRYSGGSEVSLWKVVEFSQSIPAEDHLLKRMRLF